MNQIKYGFLGCGNMGGAIAGALSTVTKDMMLSDRSGKGKALADSLGCAYGSPADVASRSRFLFLGVKPQMMEDALLPLQKTLAKSKPVLVTMAAGLTTWRIQELAGSLLPVIRIMPNTPVAIGKGVVLYCKNSLVTQEDMEEFLRDMAPCGLLDHAEEKLFDAMGTVPGCGPAYAYMFIEAMADGAVACGVPRAKAMTYAAHALAGAAGLMLATGKHPGELKDAVCSPGGSTIAGVRALEARGFRSAVTECITSACEKNKLLGK